MKLSKAIKIAIDAAMFILFVFLMGQHLTVDAHEWLGLAVFILFVLHNVLNYRWYAVLLQGRYTLLRSIQTTVNFLLLIVMIICLVSSVIVSVDVFSFMDRGGITIGDNAFIGPQARLITENHGLSPDERRSMINKPIVLENNVWIGAGATVLPGVTIGENSVVGAGAVVTNDVPKNTVVAGNPAKKIRSL